MAASAMLQPGLPNLAVSATLAVSRLPASKQAGRVLTPAAIADALCAWAIERPDQMIVDLGVGEGAFALAAARRLHRLGATAREAAERIYGAELDSAVYSQAQHAAVSSLGIALPHIVHGDFHAMPLPAADAVIGNPPYIRRHYQQPSERAIALDGFGSAEGLTDAYCLFLLRALSVLRPGGRVAVIVSASWLDMNYGRALKRFLLKSFRIHSLLSFDGRVFSDALVKPVILLATRSASPSGVSFARLKPGTPLDRLGDAIDDVSSGRDSALVRTIVVPQESLAPQAPWSALFRTPMLHDELSHRAGLVPLARVARTRIGLQTFAKPFFILGRPDAAARAIEPGFLIPVLPSPRYVKHPLIAQAETTPHVLFACDRPLDALRDTGAGRYILDAMQRRVAVRGKGITVAGYHRAPRLMRAARSPWYNVRTSVERRGAFPILLPRRVFKNYIVAHNIAGIVANEDFIEVEPRDGTAIEPLLAYLNSSLGEFFVRSQGFQYGGGVFNLNPGRAGSLPVVDPGELPPCAHRSLVTAWQTFVRHFGSANARTALDTAVVDALALEQDVLPRVTAALDEMILTAVSATESH